MADQIGAPYGNLQALTSPGITPSASTPPPNSNVLTDPSPTTPPNTGASTRTGSRTMSPSHPNHTDQPTGSPQLQGPANGGTGDASSGTGMTAGTVAGIAVGCAAIGAVVAAFIVFFIMRRSNRRQSRDGHRDVPVPLAERYSSSDSGGARELEKRPDALVAPVKGGQQSTAALDHLLPQPVDTNHLSNELSTLQSLIRNHLNNFFSANPMERQLLASSIEPSAIAEISNDTPFSADEWINLLANTQTRNHALRFIFAWVIFRRLEPECEPTKTLLPPGMNACYSHMLSETPEKKQGVGFLQSKWRVITGYLLRDQYVTRAFADGDDRAPNLQDTLRMLDAVLRPIGIEALDAARKENMNEVLKRAAAIGFTLASQPSSWIFDWEPPSQGQQGTIPLVVFPSLIQSANDQGQPTSDSLEIGQKELGNSILISE